MVGSWVVTETTVEVRAVLELMAELVEQRADLAVALREGSRGEYMEALKVERVVMEVEREVEREAGRVVGSVATSVVVMVVGG